MAEVRINLYEGMFLLNQQSVSTDFAAAIEHVRDILNRAEAEIVILSKWDERKLAYEIKKQKRGLFVLAYFKARASQIANIDRDCNLSEQVLRSLVIRADYMGEAELALAKENTELSVEARLRANDEGAEATKTAEKGDAKTTEAGAAKTAEADSTDGKNQPAAVVTADENKSESEEASAKVSEETSADTSEKSTEGDSTESTDKDVN